MRVKEQWFCTKSEKNVYRRENAAAALVQIRIKSSIFLSWKQKFAQVGILVSAAAAASPVHMAETYFSVPQ